MAADDIVARLRGEHYKFAAVPKENKLEISPKSVNRLGSLWLEAADEIERLRAVVEAWKTYSSRAERDIAELRAERDEACDARLRKKSRR